MGLLGSVVCITAVAGMGGTGLGGLVSCLLRRESGRTVSLLLSFAAGVMTSVVCFDLLADAVSPKGGAEPTPLWLVVAGVLAGYAVIDRLNVWAERGSRRERGSLLLAGLVMAAAIALHNVPEGVVIGASFVQPDDTALLSRSGLVMASVIALHNIPEGMAVAVPLISGGMRKRSAVLLTAAIGAPTVLGAAAGYYLGMMGPFSLAVSLSVASGAMLYVVFGELLPEATHMWQSKLPALAAVIGILVGMVILYA